MKRIAFFTICTMLITHKVNAQVTIFPYNDTWKYLDNGTDQGTAWTGTAFSDATWRSGQGKFGYGIPDAATAISFGSNANQKFITTYFRKTVNIPNPAAFASFIGHLKRDDGAVVYVNGKQVYSNNMPGKFNASTLASAEATDNGTAELTFNINKDNFVTGNNVIAVEIHQRTANTPDMAFDLSLTTPDKTPPSVVSINRQSPAAASINTSLVVYRVTFSEGVTGVDAPDFVLTKTGTANGKLLANAVVAVGTGRNIYDVTVSSLTGAGNIRLDLKAGGTKIVDLANNAISGGFTAGQVYALDHTSPVALSINQQSPIASSTSLASVTFRVVFSEPVTGVDLADFSVTTGGTASGTLQSVAGIGSDGATYDVALASVVGDGTLGLILNASSTGIMDVAGNAITGGFTTGQTYTIDHIAPAVASINRQSPATEATGASSIVYRVAFSESVTGVDVSDFTIVGTGTANGTPASISPVGTDGVGYDVTVSNVAGTGTLALNLNDANTGIADAASNLVSGGFTSGQSYTVSETPLVVSIMRQLPAVQNTTADAVTFRVTFTKAVTGVDATDFVVTTLSGNVRGTLSNLAIETAGTIGTESVSQADVDGAVYDVTVRALSGNGNLRVDLKSANTGITDLNGIPLAGGFSNGEIYSVLATSGFANISDIDPLAVTSHTGEKPQAKMWTYAGKWWTVMSTLGGTKIFRLDGTTWTDVLTLGASTNAKADCIVIGNLVHILAFRGTTNYALPTSNSFVYSVEYDAANNTYKPWSQRTTRATILFEKEAKTATIAMDGNGRMWIANDGVDAMYVRYSDAPYANWSAPITIADGVTDDDICALVTLPGKLGIMWSDQNAQRFGFRTHTNGTDPSVWSANEVPASQSAKQVRFGMADDHISLSRTSDGTLFAAVKTGYDTPGEAKVSLLVRRPAGTWDDLYPVTANEGTRPVVVINEAAGKVKVVYSTHEDGGDILYRESAISNITFGRPYTLLGGNPALLYNFSTSTHQTYSSDIVIMATDMTGGANNMFVKSVIATEAGTSSVAGAGLSASSAPALTAASASRKAGNSINRLLAYPNPFTANTRISFTLQQDGEYTVTLYNDAGARISVLSQGRAEAGRQINLALDGARLDRGVYFIKLQTGTVTQTIKLVRKN